MNAGLISNPNIVLITQGYLTENMENDSVYSQFKKIFDSQFVPWFCYLCTQNKS